MKNIRIEINPDILLEMKVRKVAERTGVTMDLAVNEALANFLSAEGSNNPKAEAAFAGKKKCFCQ